MPRPIEKILTLKFMLLDERSPTLMRLWVCLVWEYWMPMTPTLTSTAILLVAKAISPGETPSEK